MEKNVDTVDALRDRLSETANELGWERLKRQEAEAEQERLQVIYRALNAAMVEVVERAERTEAELIVLKAAIASSTIAQFAADVLSLANDYAHPKKSLIAQLPFLASFDQLCLEKYGFSVDDSVK
jgi:hypothetical protein